MARDTVLGPAEKLALMLEFDAVFGLDLAAATQSRSLPDDLMDLIARREKARADKDWAIAGRAARRTAGPRRRHQGPAGRHGLGAGGLTAPPGRAVLHRQPRGSDQAAGVAVVRRRPTAPTTISAMHAS